ncbi:MAG: hypothetical protein ABEK50_12990 [bacterium]
MTFRLSAYTILLSALSLSLVACSAQKKLETESGRPEINIQSPHLTVNDVSSVLLNHYLNKGYSIAKKDPTQIVVDSPGSSGMFSAQRLRLTFTFIKTRNNIRVVASMKRQNLDSLRSGNVESEVNVLPSSKTGQEVLKDLRSIKDRLMDETAFEGIEKTKEEDSGDKKTGSTPSDPATEDSNQ